MNYVAFLKDIKQTDRGLFGGKATSLGELTAAGLPVPEGFAIDTNAYKAFASRGLPPNLQEVVLDAFDNLKTERVSVRSSATVEDSTNNSWAGQFESYLNVTRDKVVDSIEDCWLSVKGAQSYADQAGSQSADLAMAVIVQKMVDAEASGVAFSVNPVTKDSNQIVIEAVWGLGELLVQGTITPDNYLVAKGGPTILERRIEPKTIRLVYKDGQNRQESVPEAQVNTSCLADAQIIELATMVSQIEQHYGSPQDIEWALAENHFYILQSRPITTL